MMMLILMLREHLGFERYFFFVEEENEREMFLENEDLDKNFISKRIVNCILCFFILLLLLLFFLIFF